MDPIDRLSGCGTIEDDLLHLFGDNHVDLDNFWAQISPPSTFSDIRHSSNSTNAFEMTGEDLSLVEAWLTGEGDDARAGDGQRRQVDAGGGPLAGGGALALGGAWTAARLATGTVGAGVLSHAAFNLFAFAGIAARNWAIT